MHVNGLNADTAKIGQELFRMLCDANDTAPLALGMIPFWIIRSTEKLLREKVIALSAAQMGCTPEEFAPYVSEKLLRETVSPIMHEISLEIYRCAKLAQLMVV